LSTSPAPSNVSTPSDGVGLGLSIASTIARAHDATTTARPQPGGGLEMLVTIPRIATSPAS
jgi:signal transduction histidine kinase